MLAELERWHALYDAAVDRGLDPAEAVLEADDGGHFWLCRCGRRFTTTRTAEEHTTDTCTSFCYRYPLEADGHTTSVAEMHGSDAGPWSYLDTRPEVQRKLREIQRTPLTAYLPAGPSRDWTL